MILEGVSVKTKVQLHFLHICDRARTPPPPPPHTHTEQFTRQCYLSKMQGEVDLVVLHTSGQWRTLPPSFGSIRGVLGSVVLLTVAGVAVVAQLTADHFSRRLIITSSRSCQTTKKFWTWNILAASCCCRYISALRQVKIRRRKHLCIYIYCQQQKSQYVKTEKPLHCQRCSGHRRKVLPTRHLRTR